MARHFFSNELPVLSFLAAMVCVMLRLLEYYTGILFLTTNRCVDSMYYRHFVLFQSPVLVLPSPSVESLDPAFQSRVQCALRYSALDAASRRRVWEDLLAHANVAIDAGIDVASLAAHELNGRQIKNALQLAVGESPGA